MTQIAPKYDSANANDKCVYCGNPIPWVSGRVIVGTGNSLLAVYHILCWNMLLAGTYEVPEDQRCDLKDM